MSTPYKQNGWQRPLAPEFIILQVLFFGSTLLYFGFQEWFFGQWSSTTSTGDTAWSPTLLQWLLNALVGGSLLIGIGGSLVASLIDPADPIVARPRNKNSVAPAEPDLENSPGDILLKDCLKCDKRVQQESLHCRYCDKCVLRLDHHCFYLNTCIGRRNYRYFTVAIAGGTVFFCCTAALTWYTFALFFLEPQLFERVHRWVFQDDSMGGRITMMVCLSVFGLAQSVFGMFLMDLVRLHVYLGFKKMSTLEYARKLRQRAKEKEDRRQLDRRNRLVRKPTLCCHGKVAPLPASAPVAPNTTTEPTPLSPTPLLGSN